MKNRQDLHLAWTGKEEALSLSQAYSMYKFQLCPERSLGESENLYIEGDNLEALRLLRNTHLGEIKMIYIDPPYNTGNPLAYCDNFREKVSKQCKVSHGAGVKDRLLRNQSYSAAQHVKWLNMMLPRLVLARDLLRTDGVIFISIDENEAHHLKNLCNEVFGEENYVETLYIQVRYEGKTLTEKNHFQRVMEKVLIYKKSTFIPHRPYRSYDLSKFKYEIVELSTGVEEEIGGRRVKVFKKGEFEIKKLTGRLGGLKATWASGTVLRNNSSGKYFQTHLSQRTRIDGYGVLYKVEGIGEDGLGFRYFLGPRREGFTKGKFYSAVPLKRREEISRGESRKYYPIPTFYDMAADFGNISHEGGVIFRGGKKPVKLIRMLMDLVDGEDFTVLDFFSGSGTTAEAVLRQNLEKGGSRKFILVQQAEEFSERSDYRAAGFENICDLGVSRIRQVSNAIEKENCQGLDRGFQYLRIVPKSEEESDRF